MPRVFVYLAVLVGVLSPHLFLYAEITYPYTVDEKTQVSFADMTSVSGHLGLENYTSEFVGNYLHITFTYTHHSCCFSSYPPSLYITAVDPRTTATPTERITDVIFQLLAGTHGTDWYLYDVQFDATGFTKTVKKTGVTEIVNTHVNVTGLISTDWVALVNTFPVSPATNFSMSFTPLEVYDTPDAGLGLSANTQSRRTPNDRNRCVETNIGWYCSSEDVRERMILETMSQILALMQLQTDLLSQSI